MQINQAIWVVSQKAENMNQPRNVFSNQILLCSLTKFSETLQRQSLCVKLIKQKSFASIVFSPI